ncbi:MAG: hypothetical protein Q4G58_01155 [bacterium]|nr:hypothetical protein [bacterium]
MCDFIKNLFTKDWDLDDKILMVSVTALAGIVIGFLFSPMKKGLNIMSGNGCNNYAAGSCQKPEKDKKKKDKEDKEDEEKDCCEEEE